MAAFQKYNIFMPEHQTFSLTTILNTNHLQPDLYRHMIHEIKSPLQEQSIELTNDNSLSFDRPPRRPNIPPPPLKSPLAHLDSQQYISHQYQSRVDRLQQSHRNTQKTPQEEVIQSFVSPLQYEINLKNESSIGFCGGRFDNLAKSEYEIEMQMPLRSNSYKRRPIFPKDGSTQLRKPSKPLQEVLSTLVKVDEPELASFVFVMGALSRQLREIDMQKIEMQKDICAIYHKLSSQTQYSAQISDVSDSHYRILRRLHSRNASDIIGKVLGKKENSQKAGQKHLEQLFTRLNNIETIITQFIQREHSLEYMTTVYMFLMNNFESSRSLKDQLNRLYESLGLGLSTDGIELIWEDSCQRKLSQSEFIEGLSLNSFVVREDLGYESDLYVKGFRRNGFP